MTAPLTVSESQHAYRLLPTQRMQGSGVPWPHDVQIALPPSYDSWDGRYPVLWVTDASLSFSLVVGLMNWLVTTQEVQEVIVVGIGVPDDASRDEFTRRRTHDFHPQPHWAPAGPGEAYLDATMPGEERDGGGGAAAVLSFLVDELRPRLGTQLRFADDHGLVGYSDGGHFVGFALLSQPLAFRRFLAASPALAACHGLLFTMETAYAATHDDLAAEVFLGAGEAELADPFLAAFDIVGSTTRMTQLLRLRDYPSLGLTCRIYPGQTHGSALSSVLTEGLRTLYARPHLTADPDGHPGAGDLGNDP